VRGIIIEYVNNHEVMSNGERVWINGPDGASVARFSSRAGRDIHKPYAEVVATGEECLDCSPSTSWEEFKEGVLKHYGIDLHEKHAPQPLETKK
jgi:hypothetical protein